MELGVSSASFCLRAYTEDTFDIMRELGVDVCEVFLSTFSEYEEKFAWYLNDKRGDIKVHSVHAYNISFEPMLYNLLDRTRSDGEVIFKKVLDCAKIISAGNYTFHGQSRLKKTMKVDMDWVGKRTEQLAQTAKSYGVDLCFENVHWAHFNQPDFFAELKKRSPSIKACLDIKQAMQSGYGWKDYLDVMGDRLKTVHISDYDADGNTCLVGDGIFDFETFFKTLRDSGFGGAVLIEQYSKDFRDIAHFQQGLDYIRNIFTRLNLN